MAVSPAPSDQYALAGDFDGGQFQRHGGDLLQDEGQGLDDPLQVCAGNLKRPGLAGIEAEEHGVELRRATVRR